MYDILEIIQQFSDFYILVEMTFGHIHEGFTILFHGQAVVYPVQPDFHGHLNVPTDVIEWSQLCYL